MDAKDELKIKNRLANTKEAIDDHSIWFFDKKDLNVVVTDLKRIAQLVHFGKYSKQANEFLKIIQDHFTEVDSITLQSRVVLFVKQERIPANSAGIVVDMLSFAFIVVFDDFPDHHATIKKELFRLETQKDDGIETVAVSGESGKDLDEDPTPMSSELDASQTNPFHAGVGGGDDGTGFLAMQSQQIEKKPRGRKPYTPEQKVAAQLKKDEKKNTQQSGAVGKGKKTGKKSGTIKETRRTLKPENFDWDLKRVKPAQLQRQLDVLNELLKTGGFWRLSDDQQNACIDGLCPVAKSGEKHAAELANLLMHNIQRRLDVLDLLVDGARVTLWKKAAKKPAGTSGKIVSKTRDVVRVLFDGDTRSVYVSKYYLDPEKTKEPASETNKLVPPPVTTSESETLPPSTKTGFVMDSVIIVDEPSVSEEFHDPDIAEPAAEQPPFVPIEPITDSKNGSTVVEPSVVSEPVESAQTIFDAAAAYYAQHGIPPQRELMVVSQLVEERFPIKDHRFFVEGCIFAMQQGLMDPLFDLYYVVKASDHPEVHRVFIQCMRLNSNLVENHYHLEFPYSKRWFNSRQPRFFYPTQQEYFLLFSQYPFAHILPLTLKQFADVDEQYRQWLLSAMETAMSKSPHWTTKLDVLLGVTELMKHHFLDKQLFPVFIQHVLEDCETEAAVDGVTDRILLHLKNEEGEELIVEDVEQAAWQAKQRLGMAKVKRQIRDYSQLIENGLDDEFSSAELDHIALIMQNVTARKENKQ